MGEKEDGCDVLSVEGASEVLTSLSATDETTVTSTERKQLAQGHSKVVDRTGSPQGFYKYPVLPCAVGVILPLGPYCSPSCLGQCIFPSGKPFSEALGWDEPALVFGAARNIRGKWLAGRGLLFNLGYLGIATVYFLSAESGMGTIGCLKTTDTYLAPAWLRADHCQINPTGEASPP